MGIALAKPTFEKQLFVSLKDAWKDHYICKKLIEFKPIFKDMYLCYTLVSDNNGKTHKIVLLYPNSGLMLSQSEMELIQSSGQKYLNEMTSKYQTTLYSVNQ